MKAIALAVVTLMLSTVAFADGPAFKCSKASSKVEKMICADPTLSSADSVNADIYKEVVQTAGNPNQVKQEQRQWLKTRNACQTVDCIAKTYDTRYNQLQHERLVNSGAVNSDGSIGH
jgi:uncharacterized protein